MIEKVAKNILGQFEGYFGGEEDIEIGLLFPFINGSKIDNFFKLIDEYSYPQKISIDPKIDYTVVVESTYCLKKNVIKKSEQLRKLFLFFINLMHCISIIRNTLKNFMNIS